MIGFFTSFAYSSECGRRWLRGEAGVAALFEGFRHVSSSDGGKIKLGLLFLYGFNEQ
jgi:hypothetical protein